MTDLTLSYASWNTTQSIQNALTSVCSLKTCVPHGAYDSEDELDMLERKLYQAYKLALKIISDIETAEDNENENN